MAVIAGNLDLAEVIKNYKSDEIGESCYECDDLMHGCDALYHLNSIIIFMHFTVGFLNDEKLKIDCRGLLKIS